MKKLVYVSILIILVVLIAGWSVFFNKNEDNNIMNKNNNTFEEKKTEDIYKIEFNESQKIAIGYIDSKNEAKFIEKYFNSKQDYNNLTTVSIGSAYKFVIIPKERDSIINVKTCYLGENGDIVEGETILSNCENSIILNTPEFEYIPNTVVEVVTKSGETIKWEAMFSGRDGKIVINENKILDISLYEE